MHPLFFIIPIYLGLFLYFGTERIKMFLLFTGIVSMPLRTTYTIISFSGSYIGWTSEILISLSHISFLFLLPQTLLKTDAIKHSKKLTKPIAFFVGACLLSAINSTWTKMTILQVIMIVQCAVLYGMVLCNAIESKEDLYFVLRSFCVSLLVQGLISVGQFLTGKPLDFFSTGKGIGELWPLASDPNLRRAVGTVGQANGFAEYISPVLMIAISLFLCSKYSKRLFGTVCLFGFVALLFSFSRGGWFGFLPGFFVLITILSRRKLIATRSVTLAWVTLIVIVLIFLPQIQDRLFGEDANAASSRIPLIRIALNMIGQHPLIGIGTNTFRSVIRSYMLGVDEPIYLHVVHNQYLLIFAEAGIVGLSSFLYLMYCFFRESVECLHRSSVLFQIIGAAAVASFVAMSIHMLVDMYSAPLSISMIFSLFAICAAVNRIAVPLNTLPRSETVRALLHRNACECHFILRRGW